MPHSNDPTLHKWEMALAADRLAKRLVDRKTAMLAGSKDLTKLFGDRSRALIKSLFPEVLIPVVGDPQREGTATAARVVPDGHYGFNATMSRIYQAAQFADATREDRTDNRVRRRKALMENPGAYDKKFRRRLIGRLSHRFPNVRFSMEIDGVHATGMPRGCVVFADTDSTDGTTKRILSAYGCHIQ